MISFKVYGFVNGKRIFILDDGCKYDLLSDRFVKIAHAKPQPIANFTLSGAFRSHMGEGTSVVEGVPFRIQTYKDTQDFLVAPLQDADMTLVPLKQSLLSKMV